MNTQNLTEAFKSFLMSEKGYPNEALYFEAPIYVFEEQRKLSRATADLVLLDAEDNNYLALLEFKHEVNNSALSYIQNQIRRYLQAIGKPELPAYLIVANDFDFDIRLLSADAWVPVPKTKFPTYRALKAKIKADEKGLYRKLEQELAENVKRKKDIFKGTAITTLLSIVFGITVALIFYSQSQMFKNPVNPVGQTCCDSTSRIIKKLSRKINEIETQVNRLKADTRNNDKNSIGGKRNADGNESKIPDSISDNSLRFQEIGCEFKQLDNSLSKEKEINEIKITNLKDRLDLVTTSTFGLIIAIIGSIVGFAINAFKRS